jgi:hypothetical protein
MRLFVFILLLCLSLGSFTQVGPKGKSVYLDVDTLKGADTVNVELPDLTGYYALSWELYFEELGGTSDGTGILQAANDTLGYVTVNSVEGAVTAAPNDTIAISDGLLQTYWLYGTPGIKYRVQLIGTTGDTTRIISNYVRK